MSLSNPTCPAETFWGTRTSAVGGEVATSARSTAEQMTKTTMIIIPDQATPVPEVEQDAKSEVDSTSTGLPLDSVKTYKLTSHQSLFQEAVKQSWQSKPVKKALYKWSNDGIASLTDKEVRAAAQLIRVVVEKIGKSQGSAAGKDAQSEMLETWREVASAERSKEYDVALFTLRVAGGVILGMLGLAQ